MLPYVRGLQFNLSQIFDPGGGSVTGYGFPDPYTIFPSKFRVGKKTLEDESSSRFSQRDEPVHARSYWSCLIMELKCSEPVFYSFLLLFFLLLSRSTTIFSCRRFSFSIFSFHLYCSQSKESIVKARKYSLLFFLSLFLYHISTG